MPLQSFHFADFIRQADEEQRTYYRSFTLQGVHYSVGDCCLLYPEAEGMPLYVARIASAFADSSPDATEVHCIEVRWFERLSNVEPSCTGPQRERELIELAEGTDVNPIGCLAGRCHVLRAGSYEEAEAMARAQGLAAQDWFYSRGVHRQSTNEFILHGATEPEPPAGGTGNEPCTPIIPAGSEFLGVATVGLMGPSARLLGQLVEGMAAQGAGGAGGATYGQAAVPANDKKKQPQQAKRSVPADAAAGAGPSKKHRVAPVPPGHHCVECGATQTPQWREGPKGPKTLCNACGVRYNRVRAAKRNGIVPKEKVAKGGGGCASGSGGSDGGAPKPPKKPKAPSAAAVAMPRPPAAALRAKEQQQLGAGTSGRKQEPAAATPAAHFPHGGLGHRVTLVSSKPAQDLPYQQPAVKLEQQRGALPLGFNNNGAAVAGVGASGACDLARAATARTVDAAASLIAMCADGARPMAGQGVNDAGPRVGDAAAAAPVGAALPPHAGSSSSIVREAALKAVSYLVRPDAAELGAAVSLLESVSGELPEESVKKLLAVARQMDAATDEVAAADSALSEALQLAAMRQAAADAARERAAACVDRLKSSMADLLAPHRLGNGHAATAAAPSTSAAAAAGPPPHSNGNGGVAHAATPEASLPHVWSASQLMDVGDHLQDHDGEHDLGYDLLRRSPAHDMDLHLRPEQQQDAGLEPPHQQDLHQQQQQQQPDHEPLDHPLLADGCGAGGGGDGGAAALFGMDSRGFGSSLASVHN